MASQRTRKIRKKLDKSLADKTVGVVEPKRKSLFDTIEENFKLAHRHIFVHRIIYIGEHFFKESEELPRGIGSVMENIISDINHGYTDEKLTGLLLYYTRYFVHMVEGSEDSLIKHFKIMALQSTKNFFSNMKLLIVIHHINRRFFNDWNYYTGKPATLLEKIEPDCDLPKTSRYINNCIQKVYQLCTIRQAKHMEPTQDLGDSTVGTLEFESLTQDVTDITIKQYLPEYNLLNFLLNTKYTRSIEEYVETYKNKEEYVISHDYIWPCPAFMTPYDVFTKAYDPIVDLPTQKVKSDFSMQDIFTPGDEEAPSPTEEAKPA